MYGLQLMVLGHNNWFLFTELTDRKPDDLALWLGQRTRFRKAKVWTVWSDSSPIF